jgi:hypothetical protein
VEQADVLERPGHAERGHFVGRQADDGGVLEEHGARGRLVDAGDRVEEGGLAGAIRADQADDRPARDDEVHVVDRDQASELLPDLNRLEDVSVLCHHRAVS